MEFWGVMFSIVKIVGIVLGIVLGVIFVIAKLFVILFTWADGRDKGYVYMKFKQWRKLYDLNPEGWCADSDNPYRCIYHKNIYVRFSFFGTARYMRWQSQAEKRKEKARSNAKLQLLLRAAQTDIEKLRAQSEQELAEAKAWTEQVRSQLGKEK